MTVGEKIKYYREMNNMTPIQLATKAELPVDNIRKYESGARNPKIEPLTKIAIALGVNINALLDIQLETVADAVPYMLKIGNIGKIEFIGEKDSNGRYTNDISIRFENKDLQKFLRTWANRIEEIDNLKKNAESTLDPDTKQYMVSRAESMEASLEAYLADSLPVVNTPDEHLSVKMLPPGLSDMLNKALNDEEG